MLPPLYPIRRGLLILIGLLLLGCGVWGDPGHTADPLPEERADAAGDQAWVNDFVAYIEAAMDEDNIPGLALALVRQDETLLVRGFGLRNVAAGAPVTGETLFHIGSTHKSMNAMLIASLVDEGVMGWDRPVAEISSAFALSDPDATQSVTIRHLLSMRAGIPEEAEDDLPDNATPRDVFSVAAQADLLGDPGEVFAYSNVSASLSGYLGVLAAGGNLNDLHTGYGDLLRQRILDPIGMQSATIQFSEAQAHPNHALSYAIGRDGQPILTPSYDEDGDALAPSGSLKASVAEMALYLRTQMAQGVAPNGSRVVSAANLTETWRPYLEEYAMGWERTTYQGITLISHDGAYDDFVSVIGFLPDQDIGFVLLINSEEAGSDLVDDAPYALVEILQARSNDHLSFLPILFR